MDPWEIAPVSVRLLGQPQFFSVGKPYRLTVSRRALSLLCFLILKRQAPVSRTAVTLAIWPDEDDASARTALRRELHRITKALPESAGEPWILANQTELCWNERAGAWLDVEAFARAQHSGDLRAAVGLYRGDLLDGIDDDWIFAERERFRVANATALNKLLISARSRHDYETALDYAGRILAEDPFREDVVRALVAIRYESGDRAGALYEAERYAKLYREELGVGLMPETEALRFAISRSESTVPDGEIAATAGARQRRLRAFTPAFVGRANEFETAIALWHRAMRGVGATVLVAGEAGIGKSRFLEELGLVAERQGGRVLVGHTSAPERLPYEAIASALGNAVPLLESVRADPAMRRSLERVVPGLSRSEAAGSVPAALAGNEREQTRLFASLTYYVSALARTRPLLLVLEDLHWARPSTLAALSTLAEFASRSRVLIVASLRTEAIDEPLAAARRDLLSRGLATALPLGRLGSEDTLAIARSTARAAHLDDASIDEIVRFSEGNPFYLLEGIVGFETLGNVPEAAGGAISDMIVSRVARMDDGVVDVASVAANIGDRFTLELLGAVCGLDEAALLDGIGQLIERHFLAETMGRSAFDYRFTHHLIRKAIYDRIPPEKRRRRHRLIARFLEQRAGRGGGGAIDIARHFDAAGAACESARWYRAAADFAMGSYANEEAATLLDRALELDSEAPAAFEGHFARRALRARLGDSEGEAEDLAAMTTLASGLGENERIRVAQCELERALRDGDVRTAGIAIDALSANASLPASDRVGLAIARTRLGELRDRRDEAIASAREGLSLVDASTPAFETAELLCRLAFMLFHSGDVGEGKELLKRAMSIGASEDGNAALVARTNLAAALNAYAAGSYEESERFATSSLDAAKIVGDRAAIAEALSTRGIARRSLRRLAEARADFDAALDAARTFVHGPLATKIAVQSSMIDADSGELARAEEICDAIIAEDVAVVGTTLVASTHNVKTFCRGLAEDYRSARDSSRRSLELFVSVGNRVHEAYALSNLGSLERELGNTRIGLEYIDRALAILEPIFSIEDLASTRSERALALAELGDYEPARCIAIELLATSVHGAGLAWQHLMFYMLWRTFRIVGDAAQCRVALERASAAFALHYDMVPEESRERFLAIPMNRALLEQLEKARLAQGDYALPIVT